jgi:hypothetical protein
VARKAGIDPLRVLSRDQRRDVSDVKYALINVLHDRKGISYPRLARLFGLAPRSIIRRNTLIRDRLMLDRRYRSWFEDITSEINT